MNTIQSGTSHLIVPKKIVFGFILVGLGCILGTYLSEHLHARRTEQSLKKKNDAAQAANVKLENQKSEYKDILSALEGHLAEWAEDGELPQEFQDKHKEFSETAAKLAEGMNELHYKLLDKEFELYDKEALLEYQEVFILDSEDMEERMMKYINTMGQQLTEMKEPLPEGLEDEIFYGKSWFESSDDF
mmetsp:Transcript_3961/g.5512  ORF Transcript_3961/g.5512 Transcript_3961/m.5512 type:complete len:188 (-) Transcript_3961:317-880(-)|eukprot:CAMPEP_0117753880 /NCGR_PEP_ID=MMETSP0947-20121206/12504_1 /TAXON_ID=44440 /ORGANISM="Chattonella subsalsa, Strain CCMP2191" /LENGTH=187 /DNA_ID=CAMNT_0005572877 /DNA_START=112 /DNA_END=675 /DNA_ORIENTATION=+